MPSILIIEDESSIAETLLFALQQEGFTTHWESLASKGLDYIKKQPVDLVIMDIGLPDISGFEACKQLRHFSDIPLIFLTARSEELDKVVGLEIGADDYVVKPFSPREVTARVKVILKRRNSTVAAMSEHIGFNSAYVISASACVTLIGIYVCFVLRGIVRGLSFTFGLGLLYALLYGLLSAEDYALLMGSILLFSILGAVMLLTRNIDWYVIGKPVL